MTEQHGHELAPTTEPTGVPLSSVLNDGPLKLGAGKQLQQLAENAGYSYHGGAGPPYGSRFSTQTVAEFYRRRSKANLDKGAIDHNILGRRSIRSVSPLLRLKRILTSS